MITGNNDNEKQKKKKKKTTRRQGEIVRRGKLNIIQTDRSSKAWKLYTKRFSTLPFVFLHSMD